MSTTPDPDLYDLGLPKGWRRVDIWIIRATEAVACLVGMTFTALITLEVASRYLFNFSIFAINAATMFLLVWFFLLGAGLALRLRAHVGFELILAYLSPLLARFTFVLAQAIVFIFFVAMLWSGYRSLASASRQVEAALQISYFWVMLAFPVGFFLLIYHQVTMFVAVMRRPMAAGPKP